ALGWAGDGLVMETLEHARGALASLREHDEGRAALLVPQTARADDRSSWPTLPSGAVWARDVVTVGESAAPAVASLLHRVAVVDGDGAAADLVASHDVTAVTTQG